MKKNVIIALGLLLLLALCGGGMAVSHSRKVQEEQAQRQREEDEKQARLLEEQKRLEEKKREEQKQEEQAAEEARRKQRDLEEKRLREKEAAQTVKRSETEDAPAGEAMIRPPAGQTDGIEGLAELKAVLEEMVSGFPGDWAVYVSDLTDREYLEINSHPVKAASLIKLYIMGAVLEQLEAGNLTDDGTLRTLLANMITVSDNESSNELVRRLSPDGTNHEEGMKAVNHFAKAYGYADTSQGRDLRDFRETPPPGENYTSVRDCGVFLERIFRGENVSKEASAQMLELLKQQTRTWKIPAGVPSGVVTANKTGELSDTENDAAIVYAPSGEYVLCVTSTGVSDVNAAQAHIVEISRTVYQYMNGE